MKVRTEKVLEFGDAMTPVRFWTDDDGDLRISQGDGSDVIVLKADARAFVKALDEFVLLEMNA